MFLLVGVLITLTRTEPGPDKRIKELVVRDYNDKEIKRIKKIKSNKEEPHVENTTITIYR